MSDAEWEARARATKAYKLARVLRAADDVPTDDWLAADEAVRSRTAVLAKVREPSDETWRMAIALLGEMRDHET